MNFTDEEKERLVYNVQQIEDYLRKLQPRIEKPIYSYLDKAPNGGYSIDKLYVSRNLMFVRTKHGRKIYLEKDVSDIGQYGILFVKSIYDDPWLMLRLVMNWDYIKQVLHDKTSEQDRFYRLAKDAINNFTL